MSHTTQTRKACSDTMVLETQRQHNLSKELHDLREEFADFKKFMYDEILWIKGGKQGSEFLSTISSSSSWSSSTNHIIDHASCAAEHSAQHGSHDGNNNSNGNNNIPQPKHIPGNSSYSGMAVHGKKVAIISDSMCRGVKPYILNRAIENKHSYKKIFPGATPGDLNYYSVRTLEKDKPDICIIHGGTNRIGKDDPFNIAKEIVETVQTCKEKGCNTVFVSGIINRPDHSDQVKILNNILYHWQYSRF